MAQQEAQKWNELVKQGQDKLTLMAERGKKRADDITTLMNEFHKYKMAAEAHKVALGSEAITLCKEHKALRKQVADYIKGQKKDDRVGLSGFTRQIASKFFKKNAEKMTTDLGDLPRYDENINPTGPTENPEANVVQADVKYAKVVLTELEKARLQAAKANNEANWASEIAAKLAEEYNAEQERLENEEETSEPAGEQASPLNPMLEDQEPKVEEALANQTHRSSGELIKEVKRLMMLLLPGQEVDWAIITQNLVENELPSGNDMLKLQAITQQLQDHPEAQAQAMALLIQAAHNKGQDTKPLQEFFEWICVKYKSTARQQRLQFARLLKDILWNWHDNPVDQIREAMNKVHLTWDEVVQDTALREELKVGVASKLDDGLFLTLSETPISDWYAKLTSFWSKLRDSKSPATVEPIELSNGDIKSGDNKDCVEAMLAKASEMPKIRHPPPDLADTHKYLQDIASALQTIAKETSNQNVLFAKPQPKQATAVTPDQGNKETRKCFKCGESGHIARNCSAKQKPSKRNRIFP